MTPEKYPPAQLLDSAYDQQHDIKLYLNTVFNNTGDPIFVKDSESRLLMVNDAFCKLFALSREEIIGKTLAEKVPKEEQDHFYEVDRKVISTGVEDVCEETITVDNEKPRVTLTRKNRFIDNNGKYFLVGIIHDITERKADELREKSRTNVLELITNDVCLPDVLQAILVAVEQENPEMLCSILLLDDEKKHLNYGAAPSIPRFYSEAINGVEIGLGVGSCGTAAFTNKRVIVEDITTHPYWAPYLELTNKADLKSCWSEPIRSSKGEVIGTFAIYHHHKSTPTKADLLIIEQVSGLAKIAIEKKQAAEKLKLAACVFSHARDSIIITDSTGAINKVNDRFTEITGYSFEDVVGKNPRLLQSGVQDQSFYTSMWKEINEKGYWTGEICNRRKTGEEFIVLQTISTVHDDQGLVSHYVSISYDITAVKAQQKLLEHIAHYDPLTNLPNRVLLADRLTQAMLQCKRHKNSLAVAFLDLDGFKDINDAYGHNVGDTLLIALSAKMKEALREGDSLARIGGDEFVAVLTDLNAIEDCKPVLDRLLMAASTVININGLILNVSASIGVTFYPQDNVSEDQLMRHADQAMYAAKDLGKNRFYLFDSAQEDAAKIQKENQEAICNALVNKEFVLYYQPKVNMRTGSVTGLEALIRWNHPEKGLLNPIDFLPFIENTPIIIKVGEWVIDTVLAQINFWQAEGLSDSIKTSVNIPAIQLQESNFAEKLASLLTRHPGVNPDRLELEVLETSDLDDVNNASEAMHNCIKLGVNFALDDFGTGYSSLTHFRRFPTKTIKIDKSFVLDMLDDEDDLAIVEGVVALAKSFKREVIAEGVETIEHGAALVKLGCDYAQGFGIARPMPASEIPRWIEHWQQDGKWKL